MAAPSPLIIDCDPGHDDAVALLMALASPDEFDILGITAVAGNVPLALTAENALRVCALAGKPDTPVHAGCARPILRPLRTAEHVHGATGLDGADLPPASASLRPAHAVDFIIDSVLGAGGEVVLAPLGPLTNIALAIVKEPAVAGAIGEIVLMGGAAGAGNITPAAEFNIHVDPHAAAVVFGAGIKLTMVGLDVTRKALVTPARLAAITSIGGPVAEAVTGLLTFTGRAEPDARPTGAPLHDPCVIAYLLKPDLFQARRARVTVETADEATIGRTTVAWGAEEPNARVIEDLDADGFFALVTERLARL